MFEHPAGEARQHPLVAIQSNNPRFYNPCGAFRNVVSRRACWGSRGHEGEVRPYTYLGSFQIGRRRRAAVRIRIRRTHDMVITWLGILASSN